MTRLILWAYSRWAWMFWLGTDSIDICVLENIPIGPTPLASQSLTVISRQASGSPGAVVHRRNQDDDSRAGHFQPPSQPRIREALYHLRWQVKASKVRPKSE